MAQHATARAVTRGNTPPTLLFGALQQAGAIPANASWKRLSGGRSNHVWRVRWSGADVVVKLFPKTGMKNPLFPNCPITEYQALGRFAPLGLAPEPSGFVETGAGSCLIYEYQPGRPGACTPKAAGRLLRRLHMVPADCRAQALRRIASGAHALRLQARAILTRCPAGMARCLAALMPQGDVPPLMSPVPVHGDAVPGNMIQKDDGRLVLIDWQCPALGDPCEDLAMFLSPAMRFLYGARSLSRAEENIFLAAYGDPTAVARYRRLAAFFHWRMAAYCLWRAARGAHDYGRALPLEIMALKRSRNRH